MAMTLKNPWMMPISWLRVWTMWRKFVLHLANIVVHVGVGGANHDLVVQQYGFPSTHSAHALVLSWVLAREIELLPGAAAASVALHTAHVCLSRLYVGVHSLADVLGGLCVGAVCVAAYEASVERIDQVGGCIDDR